MFKTKITNYQRFLLFLGLGLGLLLLISACSSQGEPGAGSSDQEKPAPAVEDEGNSLEENNEQRETISLDFYAFLPATNAMVQTEIEFAEQVKERTQGQVDIIVRPAGELPYNVAEIPNVVGQNQVAMGDSNANYSTGILSVSPIGGLPFLIQDYEEARKVMEIVKPYAEKEYQSFGATILFTYPWPQQQIWGAGSAVESFSDLKGKKIRATDSDWGEAIKLLGGIPITITPQEMPTAMERGVMDGYHTAATTVATSGWADFTEWVFKSDISLYGISYIIINTEVLESLPPDVKESLLEVSKEYEQIFWDRVPKVDEESFQQLVNEGLQVYTVQQSDKQQTTERFSSYWENWAEKRGPETQEVLQEIRATLNR